MTGKLIVFEGVEGCGKTTQVQYLRHWLESIRLKMPVVITRQPGGTELGLQLRRILLEHSAGEPIQDHAELLLYAADRAQHVQHLIKPQLAAGAMVLCDRYTASTLAYQGYGRGLDLPTIEQLNRIATAGLESDLTLWLDVPVELGLQRMQQRGLADRMERTDLEFHRRVQQGYTELCQQNPTKIVRIDASLCEQEVALQIQQVVSKYLNKWGIGHGA